jgi:uncharacterized membrane protein required for colicin V production
VRIERLKRFQAIFGRRHGAVKGFLPTIAVLCLILLALLAVAQVAHVHSNPIDADHCQLCIAMQTIAPMVAAAVVIVLTSLSAAVPQAVPAAVVWQCRSKIFIRPPPASY